MMIAPYYLDSKYYETLCVLPIKCTKKWKIKKILPIKPIKPMTQIDTTTNTNIVSTMTVTCTQTQTETNISTHTDTITPYSTPVTNSKDVNIDNFDLVVS